MATRRPRLGTDATPAVAFGKRELFAFIKACRFGDAKLVRQWLRRGMSPNAMYENTGRRALTAAAAGGRVAVVRALLDAGADPNGHDSWRAMPPRGTALEKACELGHRDVVRLLLERGASIEEKGLRTPLWTAVAHGHPELVKLLLARGARFDDSAFAKAIWAGKPETVALLLAAGADPHRRDDDGETPAHGAAIHASADIMRLLIAAGADVNVASTIQRETPLHVAARWGHLETIAALLEAGASVDALNHKKKTPEQWARAFAHPEAAALLKQYRASRHAAPPAARRARPSARPRAR